MSAPSLRLVVWSDYLCPWCANAAVRLSRIEAEFPEVRIEWRSYLLRPTPRAQRAGGAARAEQLDKFRRYVASWRRPAGEPDAAAFRFWEGSARPPTHSVPAQVVAKAAAKLGRVHFLQVHAALMRAYFNQNRDISDPAELQRIWGEQGVASDRFPVLDDSELISEVLSDHQSALDHGASGVPAVMRVGNDAVVVGSQPLETYRRWVERSLESLSPKRKGEGED